jgi:hypothetical protein
MYALSQYTTEIFYRPIKMQASEVNTPKQMSYLECYAALRQLQAAYKAKETRFEKLAITYGYKLENAEKDVKSQIGILPDTSSEVAGLIKILDDSRQQYEENRGDWDKEHSRYSQEKQKLKDECLNWKPMRRIINRLRWSRGASSRR